MKMRDVQTQGVKIEDVKMNDANIHTHIYIYVYACSFLGLDLALHISL